MNTHNMKKQSTQNHKRSLHSQSCPGIDAGKSTGKEIKGSTARRKKTPGRRQRQQQIVLRAMLVTLASIFLILTAAIFLRIVHSRSRTKAPPGLAGISEGKIPRPKLDVRLLTVNEYSRPGTALEKVRGVVIHYTANPGTSAAANRNYFEGLKDSHTAKASSHFIIGLRGEIIQCIPSSEISYASNERNGDTVSIECCIREESGKFEKATYDSAVHLTAWLVEHFGLKTEDVIRHYDVTGKACPKYFVDFPSAWEQFLADVQAYLVSYGVF